MKNIKMSILNNIILNFFKFKYKYIYKNYKL